jgi:hypothetical protein
MHQSSLRHVEDLLSRYATSAGILADIGSMDVNGTYRHLEVSTDWQEDLDPGSAPWGDTVGVFRRYPESPAGRMRRYLLRQSLHLFYPRIRDNPASMRADNI